MKTTMKSIREELKGTHGIDVVFAGKKDGISVYRIFSAGFAVNDAKYTKDELIGKWLAK